MLLAVDCSTQSMGLALYDGSTVTGEMIWQTKNHHTVELSPALDSLMKRCAVKPEDLKAFGVALGPGSFTSLRIGLALVKGMALALHLPVVGIPTLDILAASQPLKSLPMAAVLQAGRGRLAVGIYENVMGAWAEYGPAKVMTVAELSDSIKEPTLVCGELNEEDRRQLSHKRKNVILASPAQSLRRPSYLAELAWRRWQDGKVDDVVSLAPIYLHIVEGIPPV
jgi:tRNA threonylcarbamoyladenosine biosynthesis protein TsaB